MKKSIAPVIAIAVAVAIACTGLFYVLVASRLSTGAEAGSRRLVLLAARDVSRGARLTQGDVKATEWTGQEMPLRALGVSSKVDRLTAIQDIEAGQPLTEDQVASDRGRTGLGIPKGMRAISVQVHDSSGVLSLLKPGHRVDVQAVYVRGPLDGSLRTVLENIEVLRVSSAGQDKSALPVVTLLVTPAEAEVAGLADAIARVRLVLRNPLDQDRAATAPSAVFARPAVVYQPAPPRPAAPPVPAVAPQPVARLTVAPVKAEACEKPEAK
jgi:Flp pilus assembly protein CpaB